MFSGNAGSLAYATSGPDRLCVRNGLTGATKYQVRCIKDGSRRTVKMADVLEYIPMRTADLPDGFGDEGTADVLSVLSPNDIVFSLDDEEVEFSVIRGTVGTGAELNENQIDEILKRPATMGGATRETTISSQDYLSFFIPVNLNVLYLKNLRVDLYGLSRDRIDEQSITLYAGMQADIEELRKGTIVTIPLNNRYISNKFMELHNFTKLWKYEVSISFVPDFKVVPNIQFVIRNGSIGVTDFAFVNDLGGIDSIHAFGGRKNTPNFSPRTFTNNRSESLIRVDEDQVMEINSGPIQSSAERALWMSFFRSDKKWWIRDGAFGREAIKIIVEDVSPEMDAGKISEITFRFHASDKKGFGNF